MNTGESSEVNIKNIKNTEPKKSFFHTMLDEKGLLDEVFTINKGGQLHIIEIGALIEAMEIAPSHEQSQIELIMRKIDFINGDMMHFMNHLAECYISQNYKPSEEDQ